MRGLPAIPSAEELEGAYLRLDVSSSSESFALPSRGRKSGKFPSPWLSSVEADLALWSQWSRFDPRLAELWVKWISQHWNDTAPARLNESLRAQPWPAAAGVLLEETLFTGQICRKERKFFRAWMGFAMVGIPPANGEAFFIGQRGFARNLTRLDATRAEKSYRRWGYVGRERLINASTLCMEPALSPRVTRMPRETRRLVLENLCQERDSFRVEDYLRALDGRVSRRMAEMDLRACARLKPRGETRGRIYRVLGR